ncbi:hypothetical protein LTR17_017078 [Elasticomyces elasticus]|nr:hypothetical protein LTR17_017078 [Elasticomyces elasticus]
MRSAGFLLAFGVLCVSANLDSGSNTHDVATMSTSGSEPIVDMSRLAEYDIPATIRHSLDIINGIQGLASCQRIAAGALLDSCAAIKAPTSPQGHGMTSSTDPLLAVEHDLYAARMTVCDQQSRGLPIPDACQVFLPTQRNTRKHVLSGLFGSRGPSKATDSYPEYEATTTEHLPLCRNALYNEGGTGQDWTTFTGNHNTAKVTCSAMRTDIDNDEQINLMRVLLKTAADLGPVFAGTKDDVDNLAHLMNELQVNAREYIVQSHALHADYREVITRYMSDLATQVEHSLNNIGDKLREVQVEADLATDIVKGSYRVMENSLTNMETGLVTFSNVQQQQLEIILTNGQASVEDIINYMRELADQSAQQAAGKAVQHVERIVYPAMEIMEQRFRNMTEDIHVELDGARESAKLLRGDWGRVFAWVPVVLAFGGYVWVYSLVVFAVLGRVGGGWGVGSGCLAVACGSVLAKMSIDLGDPRDLILCLVYRSPDWLVAFGIIGGVLAVVALATWAVKCVLRMRRTNETERWVMERGLMSPQSGNPAQFRLPVNDPTYLAGKQGGFGKWRA